MPNRLAGESSPYLLQHANNPVDWYPWGAEAFEKARRDHKPIFLSVGYSACHWCHVMERESFENPATADLLNRHFVSVKVDREERPDIDAIYMEAVQAMAGRGGWPMSVFLTSDGAPFYGGTYFPDTERFGMPAFARVLEQISSVWTSRNDEVQVSADRLSESIRSGEAFARPGAGSELQEKTLREAESQLARSFDSENGGFGDAPKFPQPLVIEFLLRRHSGTGDRRTLEMATITLDAMARGGIHDHLGGGFHRYSVDGAWLVPHFEKMLYDNALLARAYLRAWQVTRDPGYRRVAISVLDYMAREMTSPEGGFYSSQDADSEGEEGRFFVWRPGEIRAALSEVDAALFLDAYGVTEAGNFDGSSILSRVAGDEALASRHGLSQIEVAARLERSAAVLLGVRETRVRPAVDDKVLASWNGLALGAFAEAGRVLGREDYVAAAVANATFLLESMRTAEGRMLHAYKAGAARLNGYLEDYANVADGLLELYQAIFDAGWLAAARGLADEIVGHFADDAGGFFDTSDDHERLIARPKSLQDGAQPSGGSMATSVLLRLAAYTGDGGYADAADGALRGVQGLMPVAPLGFGQWMADLDLSLAPPTAVAIVGEGPGPMLEALASAYRPNVVVAYGSAAPTTADEVPLLAGRHVLDGRTTAFVCRGTACMSPVTEAGDLVALLDE